MTAPRCECCGTALDEPQSIDVRFTLPDVAFDVPEEDRRPVNDSLLRADGMFVRCLLPVRLSGGYELVLGTWLELSEEDFVRAASVWGTPHYAALGLTGTLANDIRPWDLAGAPAMATVRVEDEIPYVSASDDPRVRDVLALEWDRDEVLRAFGHPLSVTVRDRLNEEWSIERTAGLAGRIVDGTKQFAGPGRTVYLDLLDDELDRIPEEFLGDLIADAPEVPAEQTLTTQDGDEVRHVFWQRAVVDGHEQHELYGYVVRPGTALAVSCFYDDPADHAWAMHVFRSAIYLG